MSHKIISDRKYIRLCRYHFITTLDSLCIFFLIVLLWRPFSKFIFDLDFRMHPFLDESAVPYIDDVHIYERPHIIFSPFNVMLETALGIHYSTFYDFLEISGDPIYKLYRYWAKPIDKFLDDNNFNKIFDNPWRRPQDPEPVFLCECEIFLISAKAEVQIIFMPSLLYFFLLFMHNFDWMLMHIFDNFISFVFVEFVCHVYTFIYASIVYGFVIKKISIITYIIFYFHYWPDIKSLILLHVYGRFFYFYIFEDFFPFLDWLFEAIVSRAYRSFINFLLILILIYLHPLWKIIFKTYVLFDIFAIKSTYIFYTEPIIECILWYFDFYFNAFIYFIEWIPPTFSYYYILYSKYHGDIVDLFIKYCLPVIEEYYSILKVQSYNYYIDFCKRLWNFIVTFYTNVICLGLIDELYVPYFEDFFTFLSDTDAALCFF